jgi:hypothetical protein
MKRHAFLFATVLIGLTQSLSAQAPLPSQIPLDAPASVVRARFAQMGLHASRGVIGDSVTVFSGTRGGVSTEIRARFRNGFLYHAFYVSRGDSAALQREIDATVTAASSRFGRGLPGSANVRVWQATPQQRFTVPACPIPDGNGHFTFSVVYHRG